MIVQKIARIVTIAAIPTGLVAVALATIRSDETYFVVSLFAAFIALFCYVLRKVAGGATPHQRPVIPSPLSPKHSLFDQPLMVHPSTALPIIGGADAYGNPPCGPTKEQQSR